MDKVKVAFWSSFMNANCGFKYLDYDSADQIVTRAWEGFEQPFKEAALYPSVITPEVVEAAARGMCLNMTLSEDNWQQFTGPAEAALQAALVMVLENEDAE